MNEASVRANADVCKALGLDPNVTSKVVIVLDPVRPVRVYARQYVVDREAERLVKVIRRFKVTGLGAEEAAVT